MKVLGIVPARGGSKGIIGKNLQKIGDKSLLARALETAIDSRVLDRIIVSSDDDAILAEAAKYSQVSIPFKRPAELAEDNIPTAKVIIHLLRWLQDHENYMPDAIMLLEPTCPFRVPADVIKALNIFQNDSASCLLSVSPPLQHPSDFVFKKNEKEWDFCFPRQAVTQGRQNFNQAWFVNGAIYITKADYFMRTEKFYDLSDCSIYKMSIDSSFDIDVPFELELARAFYQLRKTGDK